MQPFADLKVYNFIKKRLQHKHFPGNIVNSFFVEGIWWLPLGVKYKKAFLWYLLGQMVKQIYLIFFLLYAIYFLVFCCYYQGVVKHTFLRTRSSLLLRRAKGFLCLFTDF